MVRENHGEKCQGPRASPMAQLCWGAGVGEVTKVRVESWKEVHDTQSWKVAAVFPQRDVRHPEH